MDSLFDTKHLYRSYFKMALPVVLGMVVTLVYNLADTFFIAQTNDTNLIAGVSLCSPVFTALMAFGNIYGQGGSSLISRLLGQQDGEGAKRVSSFCFYIALATGIVLAVVMTTFNRPILTLLGADAETFPHAFAYYIVLVISAPIMVLSFIHSSLVRCEGMSTESMVGTVLGAVVNIILDPILILLAGLEIAGAAIATMVSNVLATLYFISLLVKRRNTTDISFHPKNYTWGERIPREVLLVGFPSCLMNLMGVLSNITVNKLMSGYSNAAVAGIGVAKKVDMLSFAIATGMSQGVLPLIGYNYSARHYKRIKAALKLDFLVSFMVALVGTIFLFTCAGPIVQAFIDDAETVRYGQRFQRIICITGPCISVTMLAITAFQSVGKKVQPTILSLMRKGGLDIPFMFLLNGLLGVNGIVWATPIADVCAMIVAVIVLVPFWKMLSSQEKKDPAGT